jgi:hypothetical protein
MRMKSWQLVSGCGVRYIGSNTRQVGVIYIVVYLNLYVPDPGVWYIGARTIPLMPFKKSFCHMCLAAYLLPPKLDFEK